MYLPELNTRGQWLFACAILTTPLTPGCIDNHNSHSVTFFMIFIALYIEKWGLSMENGDFCIMSLQK